MWRNRISTSTKQGDDHYTSYITMLTLTGYYYYVINICQLWRPLHCTSFSINTTLFDIRISTFGLWEHSIINAMSYQMSLYITINRWFNNSMMNINCIDICQMDHKEDEFDMKYVRDHVSAGASTLAKESTTQQPFLNSPCNMYQPSPSVIFGNFQVGSCMYTRAVNQVVPSHFSLYR